MRAAVTIFSTFVLRYDSIWETLKAGSGAAATAEKIQRELDLLRGWRPTAKPRTESASKVKMLDAAMDEYLAEVEAGRNPKTLSGYKVALRYFYECVGNKPLKDINRPDILDFPVFLREEKNQVYSLFPITSLLVGKPYLGITSRLPVIRESSKESSISEHRFPDARGSLTLGVTDTSRR